ncbi:MAG: response regulator transcription factor [Anaerolineaceae bacterium]|nr:response regulator transcription factor [Anaerolineaceae bacterium]
MYNYLKIRPDSNEQIRKQARSGYSRKGFQSMAKILIVDDEPVIIESLAYSLHREGYEVFNSSNGKDALELFNQCQPDLVVLDIRLPEMDGLEVCKRLRNFSTVPIIMLTARTDELDRILGLEVGADDYLPKPFSFRELLARIRALLRRVAMDQQVTPGGLIQIGGLTIDPVARRVLKNHQEIQVSAREFEILKLMMAKPGQACSRQELLAQIWGEEWLGDARTLEVHIRWLRLKVEDDPTNPKYIQTVRGYGYRFISQEELA